MGHSILKQAQLIHPEDFEPLQVFNESSYYFESVPNGINNDICRRVGLFEWLVALISSALQAE